MLARGLSVADGVAPRARRDMPRQRRGIGGVSRDRRVADSKTGGACRETSHAFRIVTRGRRANSLERRSLDEALGELDGQARPTRIV